MARSVQTHADVVASLVADVASTQPAVRVPFAALLDGRPRVLAEPVRARAAVPAFPNSQMDGFAVRAADLAGASAQAPVLLPVVAAIAAGTAPSPLPMGAAAAIMTGAWLPEGADAVVRVEDTQGGTLPDHDAVALGASVGVTAAVAVGTFVRPAGDDIAAGDVLADAGTAITPAVVGALAACAIDEVVVRSTVRVAVVVTGDELDADAPGRVPDSDGPLLCAALARLGCAPTLVHAGDGQRALAERLRTLASGCDVIVTTGGLGPGTWDAMRILLEGGEPTSPLERAWCGRVAMQPGGPQGVAVVVDGERTVPVVALPGNPVSVLVSFETLLRAPLAALVGAADALPVTGTARLATPLRSAAGVTQWRRAQFVDAEDAGSGDVVAGDAASGERWVEPVGGPGSHLIAHAARSHLLLRIDEHTTDLAAGDRIDWQRLA